MLLSIHCDVPYVLSLHYMIRWLDSSFSSFSICRVFSPRNVDPVLPDVEECFYLVSLTFCHVSCLRANLRSRARLHFLAWGCKYSCSVWVSSHSSTHSHMKPYASPEVSWWYGQHFLMQKCTFSCGNAFLRMAWCTSSCEILSEVSSHAGNRRWLLQFSEFNFWSF